jgi:uncharacterized protein CbrC (UPF0167 family)
MTNAPPVIDPARAILRSLQERDGLESTDAEALRLELLMVLETHSAALIELVRQLPSHASWRDLTELAATRGIATGDSAVAPLTEELVRVLESSAHVVDLYLEDDSLHRVLHAVLFDFVRSERDQVLTFFTHRSLPEQVPRAPLRSTFADRGWPFPLFEAPIDLAAVDVAGPCAFCQKQAELRFRNACYACFRDGRAPRSVETELGLVSPAQLARNLGGKKRSRRLDEVDLTYLVELTRTPAYSTWQGVRWLFCCEQPMIFVGGVDTATLGQEGGAALRVASLFGIENREEAEERLEQVLENRISTYRFRCPLCNRQRACYDHT